MSRARLPKGRRDDRSALAKAFSATMRDDELGWLRLKHSELDLRKLALGEAIRHNTPGGPAEVVRAAEKYLAFLKGKSTKRGK